MAELPLQAHKCFHVQKREKVLPISMISPLQTSPPKLPEGLGSEGLFRLVWNAILGECQYGNVTKRCTPSPCMCGNSDFHPLSVSSY